MKQRDREKMKLAFRIGAGVLAVLILVGYLISSFMY